MVSAFSVLLNKSLHIPRLWRYFSFIFSSFLVLSFWVSTTHVYLILSVEWERREVSFLSTRKSICSSNMFKKTTLFPLNWLGTLIKTNWPHICGSISGWTVLFHWYICLSLGQYLITVALQFLFKIVLAILYQLHFQI